MRQGPGSPPRRTRRLLLASACIGVAAVAYVAAKGRVTASPPERSALPHVLLYEPVPNLPLEQAVENAELGFPPPDAHIVVRKAEHVLELSSGQTLLKTYPIAFGATRDGKPAYDLGPKRREGDRRTPEGRYFVCTRTTESPYHLFLGISYPSEDDAAQGLAEGAISEAEHEGIRGAIRDGGCPPWDTALGGEIGFHGGGIGSEWTWGCIALTNEAIEELWAVCPLGTPVEIEP